MTAREDTLTFMSLKVRLTHIQHNLSNFPSVTQDDDGPVIDRLTVIHLSRQTGGSYVGHNNNKSATFNSIDKKKLNLQTNFLPNISYLRLDFKI